MVSKIFVPCDFGIEKMYDPFHGNVTIEFNDDSKIKVNSLILSWNSATFCHIFDEFRLTNVEIKDFTKNAVILYLESLYTGKPKLENHLFRELYKLSVVFKTKWLTDRCTDFFYQLVENVSNEFEDLCFVFNEALNAHKTLKNEDFMEMVVDRFSKIDNISSLFVERYLTESFSSITSETLDNLLLICQEDYVPVLESLKQYLTEGDFDDTTRSLLSNSKVVECLSDNLDICEEVYELLAIKSGNMAGDDLKMVTNLNLCVIRASRGPSKTLSKQVVPVKDIPNLFHDRNVFKELSDEEKIWKLCSMPNISYFMIVEICFIMTVISDELREKILQNITQIFANKSLCTLPSAFVQGFLCTDWLAKLPQSVISDDNTAVIIGSETTLVQLVNTSELYKFYFQHPAAPQCEKHTECGFMLKVTPCSKEEVGSFNIELVTEEREYPADIHCHSEVISAAHIHLVVEWYYSGIWYNRCISWRGKPEYSEERGGVVWGGMLWNNCRVRLVVYYDIRDKK